MQGCFFFHIVDDVDFYGISVAALMALIGAVLCVSVVIVVHVVFVDT